jgi:pimeloyl-ACP methyl ester carboxylesterase
MKSFSLRFLLPVSVLLFPMASIPALHAEEAAQNASAHEWPGKKSDFHSFDQYDFEWNGVNCRVVTPRQPAEGRPWIWRARFFGHEPQTDIALLQKGFHVVYADVAGLFGSPEAVKRWNGFYEYLVHAHQFDPKTVLEGMSRGGLIVYNWAAANPGKVYCIYADAPVCDIRSWPGGKGKAAGSPADWEQCKKAYGFSEEEALAAPCNPIDNLEPLARQRIPLLHVVGDADEVVPVAENTAILEERYNKLGGKIRVIHKPGIGHHPHSLQDPAPIVDFILSSMKSKN